MRRSFILLAATCTVGALNPAPLLAAQPATLAQSSDARQFEIAAGPLGAALTRFAEQAQLRLLAPTEITAELRTRGVSGQFTAASALSALLADTGLTWRRGTDGVISLERLPGGDAAMVLAPVQVRGGIIEPVAGTPEYIYTTPGSSNVVTREQLDRVPVVSARDVFINTPGVWVRDGRQDPAMEINIRGVQGPGRIAITLDGARQDASSYYGYGGMKSRVYVDPELLAGVDIEKGPTSGAGGAGQIGGTVAFRTLGASDLIKDGQWQGYRVRAIDGDNGTEHAYSAAGAWRLGSSDNFDIAVGVSKRRNSEYETGTRDPNMRRRFIDSTTGEERWTDLTRIQPGAEVPFVFLDSWSGFAKATARLGDGHTLEFGTTRYDSDYSSASIGLNPSPQREGSNTKLSTYTTRYHWLPANSNWIDLNTSVWYTRSDVTRHDGVLNEVRTWGGEAWNGTSFELPWFDVVLTYGGEYRSNDMDAFSRRTGEQRKIGNVVGEQTVGGGFFNAKLLYRQWLELRAGVRYDTYNLRGNGTMTPYLSGQTADVPFEMDRGDDRFNPSATLVIKPWQGVQFYAAYTEGMRPPSIGESLFSGQYFVEFIPNLFLEAEIARNRELGVNVLFDSLLTGSDRLGVKLAWFDNRYDNYIERRTIIWPGGQGIGGGAEQSVNLDSAHFKGGEINLNYDIGFTFLEAGYSHFTFMEYCERGVCNSRRYGATPSRGGATVAPKYKLSGTAGLRLWDRRLTLGTRVHTESERMLKQGGGSSYSGEVGIDSMWAAYSLWDAFASVRINSWFEAGLSVENLRDKYYIDPLSSDVVPAPGRTFKAMFTATF